MKKLWAHPTLKGALSKYQHDLWLFDGKKLAWAPTLVDRGEIRVLVDLDEGRLPPSGAKKGNNKFHVTIKNTTQINVSVLQAYLGQKVQFDNSVQEALNFLDHLLRQGSSERMLAIKRNFYDRNAQPIRLDQDGVIEVRKGTYASLRLSGNLDKGAMGMALNVDVSNTCFWVGKQTFSDLLCKFLATCDRRYKGIRPDNLSQELRPVRGKDGNWEMSDAFKYLRKMRKLRFSVRHPGRPQSDKLYTACDIPFSQRFAGDGANAKTVTFDYEGGKISVADYYANKYKAFLRYTGLPVIDAGKAGYIPMEFAWVEPMQRYAFKLNPDQTASMIKIAVTRPAQRKSEITKHVGELRLNQDPYLRHYGVEFEPSFTTTDARVLQPPMVKFGQGAAKPEFTGRWDLRGKKFWKQNFAPLSSWGFIVLDDCVNYPQLQEFARSFKSTFINHGGKCLADPHLLNVPGNIKHNVVQALAWAHEEITKRSGYTQLLFIVVQHRNSPHYLRLKKSADCRFGILTQVVNGTAVAKNNGQYHSNVCLKVNAKLGGATSRTDAPWRAQGPTYFPKERPTMIIGVDVSHAAPGGVSASTGAMTMNVDRDGVRYAAVVETNGYRTEMLTEKNIKFMFGELSKHWKQGHEGQFPSHIIYFRDGVDEGQFAKVVEQEIGQIKQFFKDNAPKMPPPKFTVIVATKRHHIRFFPKQGAGDRNGNPQPGTLVEKEVTHPFMWDFYLSSHVAIQGTARPVHYHVLLDEMGVPCNDLQKMIYHQCYSYARSTTPVSLHPAVYYAHLASNRAKAHDNAPTSDGPTGGAKGHEMARDREAKGQSLGQSIGALRGVEAPKLLPLGGARSQQPVPGEERQRDFIRGTMWYI